jgi:outer membrane murein-binding lipoprotein Lpp
MSGIGLGLIRGAHVEGHTVVRMARAFGVLLVAALAVLGGCASEARSGAPSSTYTTSLAALQDKVDSIAQDSCTTRPAVQAYPDCARYVAEVGNAALATQGAAASVNGADALHTTAARLADEVGLFSRTGCVAAPGVAGPPAQVCGDALRKIQVDLTAMRTQLAEATPAP